MAAHPGGDALIGVFPFYGALVGLLAIAGLANSVYHPADYAILSASVSPEKMGRAFSLHTTAGYMGDALAPVTMVFLLTVTDWQTAIIICGVSGTVMAIVLALNSSALNDSIPNAIPAPGAPPAASANAGKTSPTGVALLFTLPILMGLMFFMGISTYSRGISSFGPSVLHLAYDAPIATASGLIACFLFAQPAGVLVGGWIANRIKVRHGRRHWNRSPLIVCWPMRRPYSRNRGGHASSTS